MVARQGNMKRKNGNKPGNVRRFKQGFQGGFKQQMQQPQQRNGRNGVANVGAMFNPNQMMDNPGYMDFNEPTIRPPPIQKPQNKPMNLPMGNKVNNIGVNGGLKNRGRRQNNPRNVPNNVVNPRFGPGRNNMPPPGNYNGIGPVAPFRGGPLPARMLPMPPPMGIRPGDFDYPPQFFPQRFGPGPIPPPPIGMMGPPIGRPLGPRRPPIPPAVGGPIIPPFRGNGAGPKLGKNNRLNKRRRIKVGQKQIKVDRKAPKKVSNVDKYPLDKPWVNDEVKAAHDKKVELANGLKGKKDDQLFAEFKTQRDKFINLYDAAQLEYIGKHKEQVNSN